MQQQPGKEAVAGDVQETSEQHTEHLMNVQQVIYRGDRIIEREPRFEC